MSHDASKPFGLNEETSVAFLFDISKQVKHFYETPVIFLTQKDYSDAIFNTLCSIRSALLENARDEIMNIIVDFHLHWLHAIKDVEQFKKRINDLPREEVYQAISYTIDAMSSRLRYYQKYIQKYQSSLSNIIQSNIIAENEIIEEMHKEVTKYLLSKLKCFRAFDSDDIFQVKLVDAIEEFLHWIDKINDSAAMLLCNYINVNVPYIYGDLTKTLQQIVDDFKNSKSLVAQKLLDDLRIKGKELSTMIRCTAGHDLEMTKVVEKISILESRISRLEDAPSSAAVLALTNKKDYLEKRLNSLENLKTTLKNIHKITHIKQDKMDDDELCSCEDYFQLRIFNHDLPPEEREHLVTELCHLWDMAVFGERGHKSIISILSAVDVKEQYTDELGTFYIDEYSRKIYKLPDDEISYQVNDMGKLIPLSDDAEHVYFYDECGRYYIDQKTRLRVYKAHSIASEYMMDATGILLKLKEERDGITYYYDNYGRYYINDEGKHIYREEDTASEYENDGLGNLVRIRSHIEDFKTCPDEITFTKDSKYLQLAVGKALRECIADVLLHQPADPIKYLSESLIHYRKKIELKEKESKEKEDLNIEREIKIAEERAAAQNLIEDVFISLEGESEESYDSNLMNYTTNQFDNKSSEM